MNWHKTVPDRAREFCKKRISFFCLPDYSPWRNENERNQERLRSQNGVKSAMDENLELSAGDVVATQTNLGTIEGKVIASPLDTLVNNLHTKLIAPKFGLPHLM